MHFYIWRPIHYCFLRWPGPGCLQVGSALGITYNFYKKFTVAGNLNFNKMKSNETNDIFVTGFNTPQWSSAYNTVDAQITLRVPKAKSSFKLGASNIFNKRYIQYAGGPTIGGLCYLAITLDGLLNK